MIIAFDFSILTRPYRLQRCIYQMVHLATIAERMGHTVKAIVNDHVTAANASLSTIKHLWTYDYGDMDIYFAKADAYYRDLNWEHVSKLKAFKVCGCNSDKCFRESDKPWQEHLGTPVQTRCDLYMPVNHTAKLIQEYGHKVLPVAHPIDPRMANMFRKRGLYDAYLDDDVVKLRNHFKQEETGVACFMGNIRPKRGVVEEIIKYADFSWKRAASPTDYINWMMKYRGCLDIRGNGDKSLRFTESAMLGRTIICVRLPSGYYPPLINGKNCFIADTWQELADLQYEKSEWLKISEEATENYINGWSLRSQVKAFIDKSGI